MTHVIYMPDDDARLELLLQETKEGRWILRIARQTPAEEPVFGEGTLLDCRIIGTMDVTSTIERVVQEFQRAARKDHEELIQRRLAERDAERDL